MIKDTLRDRLDEASVESHEQQSSKFVPQLPHTRQVVQQSAPLGHLTIPVIAYVDGQSGKAIVYTTCYITRPEERTRCIRANVDAVGGCGRDRLRLCVGSPSPS